METTTDHPYGTNYDDADCVSDSSASSVSSQSVEESKNRMNSLKHPHSGHHHNKDYTDDATHADPISDEVNWWKSDRNRTESGTHISSEPLKNTGKGFANDYSNTFHSGWNSDNSGSDFEHSKRNTNPNSNNNTASGIPPPTPPRPGKTDSSKVNTPSRHPYDMVPPRRHDSPSPVGHQRTSSVTSTHSDRPPRPPSEEKNMAAVWVELPTTTLPPSITGEPHRRRTPRNSSGPPSPATSTLAASFSSTGDHNNNSSLIKATQLASAVIPLSTEVTDEPLSVSSVSGEISPVMRAQGDQQTTHVTVSLTPPTSVTAGRTTANVVEESPAATEPDRTPTTTVVPTTNTIPVSESLLSELLAAYNTALSEIHSLKREVTGLKRDLAVERSTKQTLHPDLNEHSIDDLQANVVSSASSSHSSSCLEGDLLSMEYDGDNDHTSSNSNNDDETLRRLREAVARAHKRAPGKH
ncbi:dentin sialophosphoprotein precursor [Angomonas deanei]|uniref:Uncharacterized protein n=1 Tax=Angomonas deanei TaxID=59799 RepID=A0A7G2CHF6_9TRYP|nr:dentin sialophosphoprotein precursor [Angomonas deanei]CAD2219186.1 hypothetical protein, conserved [Angomonas deanei]|eukprot:EPY17716.1 dentin sialophosphoprotein precursor [Angomonas deanei]